jgi:hypothetical protein
MSESTIGTEAHSHPLSKEEAQHLLLQTRGRYKTHLTDKQIHDMEEKLFRKMMKERGL